MVTHSSGVTTISAGRPLTHRLSRAFMVVARQIWSTADAWVITLSIASAPAIHRSAGHSSGTLARALDTANAASQTSAGTTGSRYRGPHCSPPWVPVTITATVNNTQVAQRTRSPLEGRPGRHARI